MVENTNKISRHHAAAAQIVTQPETKFTLIPEEDEPWSFREWYADKEEDISWTTAIHATYATHLSMIPNDNATGSLR